MPLCALMSRLRREESGFTVIEVMVTSLIIVIVSLGVLKSIDAANARSGYQKHRAVAASLAQQDQERLRAFRAADLSNHSESRTKTVGQSGATITYRIISRTDWVSDQSGTRSCGTGARADYIRISSTVVWADPSDDEQGMRRVSIASIVAPRAGSFTGEGSLSIQVQDRAGVGRPTIPVSVSGPKSLSGTTDANGCLFFGYLPQGNYTVNVDHTGFVDGNGVQNVSRQFGVSNGSITTAVIEYDVGANLSVTFTTRQNGVTVTGQKADQVSISHPSLASPTYRVYDSDEPSDRPEGTYALGTAYAPKLFPFTSAYAAYSGNCPGNRPSFYSGVGWTQFSPVLTAGANATMTVHEPSVLLRPAGSGTNAWPGGQIPSGAIAALRPETSWGGSPTYCSDTKYAWTLDAGATSNNAWLVNFFEPAPYDYGFPMGAYDLCVAFNDGSGWKYQLHSNPSVLQPLDDGPTGTHASITVAKPTGTTNCL